uniref:Calmodulin regulated spectrin-associated protein family, member 2b n=1 Tax=Knipowitschia caucasica TaxID=637954 RepID=A0AAV2JTZ6_KNICA
MGDAADNRGMKRTYIVPSIKSFDHYDFTRAKISCSLTWLVAKAFGSDAVPEELVEPFYQDQYHQEHLKPPVAHLLQSAELYCRAGSLILRSDAVKPLLGHNAIIQALAQKGLYVTDQDRLVTERDLTSTPIHMSSHLALIDTLMMAYTVEMVSVERVMACINRFSAAETLELPYDTEDAIITWVNKVNENLRDIFLEEHKLKEATLQDNTQKARYRRELAQQLSAPVLPLVDNLLKDNTDGCALTALLHFYCPQAVALEDICLKESMSLADSLYNLQLVQDFCSNNLNHCCHFSLEDLLYAHASIKSNYLVFMAELFWWFEVVKPSFVQPKVFDPNACEVSCSNMAPVTSPVKQNYAETNVSAQCVMKRSTSLSFEDGTWPKETRSSSQGISFEIPLDGGPPVPLCEPLSLHMTRSVSSDVIPFKVHYASEGNMKSPSLVPLAVNGQRGHVEEEDCMPHKPVGRNHTFSIKNQSRYSNGVLPESTSAPLFGNSGHISPTTPPSIEEALKIIHDTERPHASLGIGDGFYLHGTEPSGPPGAHAGAMIRMTSFAEQKFRKLEGRSSGGTTPESSELNVPCVRAAKTPPSQISTPPLPIISPSPKTSTQRDPSHLIASEMIQLRMKLEEKRRAIEAQKKKVEAAFTRHRQRMGRTAFLNVVRRKGVIPSNSLSPGETEKPSLESLPSPNSAGPSYIERAERCKPDGAAPKSPCEDGSVAAGEVDLSEYTRSIERLNSSLGFLQTEMQRLAQQQDKIMAMREQQQQAWVIPPPAPSPHRQLRELRSSSVTGRGSGRGSVGSLSPNLSSTGSHQAPERSSSGLKRRPASFHARTPRTPRPNDLKVTPFSRMLNTPTSVDSLPRLRRFTPQQSQLSSFAYLGHDETPDRMRNCDGKDDKETTKEESSEKSAGTPEGTPQIQPHQETESVSNKEAPQSKHTEVLQQPVAEVQCEPTRADLVQVALTELKLDEEGETGDETFGDQKMCCGFFFKDDVKGDDDMAAKKAALLEKKLRRDKEAQEKKQQQDLDQEQKREAARLKAEDEQLKKEEEKARREYIKCEFLRRKQLKDMDEVVKPRAGSLKKKPRPTSIHRDVLESTPAHRGTGVRPRGYSVSSVSLASLNLADNDNQLEHKKNNRPDSAGGFSSCPSAGSRNEKDWEVDSTTSSTPSNADYTGPKLYKEPSAKSNKHIIQNALSHCCLAGKVNEGQKNKILDEMEKSEINNFLVLFRDAGCQFRSVYTYCPESEEIVKLAGIGPKSITTKMIENIYKYNSDRKQFSQIPAKTMSANVDAVTIAGHLWQTKKQGTPKKLQPK